jgi:hypothetical protein
MVFEGLVLVQFEFLFYINGIWFQFGFGCFFTKIGLGFGFHVFQWFDDWSCFMFVIAIFLSHTFPQNKIHILVFVVELVAFLQNYVNVYRFFPSQVICSPTLFSW